MNRRTFLTNAAAVTLGGAALPALRAAKAPPVVARGALGSETPAFFKRFPASTEFEPAVPVIGISTGRVIHRFFDTSPISPSGRYVGLAIAQVLLTRSDSAKLTQKHRIDAHPVWDRTGRFVVFNGVHNDTRSVYIADLGAWLEKAMVPGPG